MQKEQPNRIELDTEQKTETKEQAPVQETPTELTVTELEERIAPIALE